MKPQRNTKAVNSESFRQLIPPSQPPRIAQVLHYMSCNGIINGAAAASILLANNLASSISALKEKYGIQIVSKTAPGSDRQVTYSLEPDYKNQRRAYSRLLKWGYQERVNPTEYLSVLASGWPIRLIWSPSTNSPFEPSPSPVTDVIATICHDFGLNIEARDIAEGGFSETGERRQVREYTLSKEHENTVRAFLALQACNDRNPIGKYNARCLQVFGGDI